MVIIQKFSSQGLLGLVDAASVHVRSCQGLEGQQLVRQQTGDIGSGGGGTECEPCSQLLYKVL